MNILTEKKKCGTCKELKNIEEFTKESRRKDGLSNRCKACEKNKNSKWRLENIDKARLGSRNWKKNNIERVREYEKNIDPQKKSASRHRWRISNLEKARETVRKWYAKNPETGRALSRIWAKANPGKAQEYRHARIARIKGNGGRITANEWNDLKKMYQYTCLCCGRKEPEIKLTLDHVVPIKLGGPNVIENAQPLCGKCNCSKNAKYIDYRPTFTE